MSVYSTTGNKQETPLFLGLAFPNPLDVFVDTTHGVFRPCVVCNHLPPSAQNASSFRR